MKYLLMIIITGLLLLSSCSKDAADKAPVTDEKVYTIDELNSGDFEYKEGKITVSGLCVHVCAHSGKKMFITGKDPENKLQIFTSADISVFDKKYEGSNLQVTGTLEEEKIDMNYIKEWESEIAKEGSDGEKLCEFEESMKKINGMKDKVVKSKKGYISIYTMTGFEVKTI